MQGNGFKVFLTAFFLVLSAYYLYPSVQNYFIKQKIEALPAEEAQTYQQENATRIRTAEEKSLKLGLDLLGGMHVTLEVRVDALIRELATDKDEVFESVLAAAVAEANATGNSVIEEFVDEFEARDSEARLSRYFRNEGAGITRRSTNAEVAAFLRTEADGAVTRAI
ncbi:MAG: hypothetical protein HKN17_08060 [Rhodothermales bacterium]|nr:hypothetical protein [Rhodothermales bacterium]